MSEITVNYVLMAENSRGVYEIDRFTYVKDAIDEQMAMYRSFGVSSWIERI